MAENEKKLPTLAELHADPEQAFKKDELNMLLNQPPHKKWIKLHPLAKTKNDKGQEVPAQYIPIDKIEYMLTRIFQEWKVEILDAGLILNACYVTVRLHVKNPLTGAWMYHDGIGAKSVQTKSGSAAADLSAITDAAVMMALPSAKSYAIKDAAEHFGALFGRDLNRRDLVEFRGAYNPESVPEGTRPEPKTNKTQNQTQSSGNSDDIEL